MGVGLTARIKEALLRNKKPLTTNDILDKIKASKDMRAKISSSLVALEKSGFVKKNKIKSETRDQKVWAYFANESMKLKKNESKSVKTNKIYKTKNQINLLISAIEKLSETIANNSCAFCKVENITQDLESQEQERLQEQTQQAYEQPKLAEAN